MEKKRALFGVLGRKEKKGSECSGKDEG